GEECHEAAIACSDQSDLRRVHVRPGLEMFGCLLNVFEVRASAVVYVQILELDAIACAPANVRRKDRVSSDYEGLDGRVPDVRNFPRGTPMDPEDAGAPSLLSCRFEEPSMYGSTVEGAVDHWLRSSQRKVCEMLVERLYSTSLQIAPG